MRISPPCKCDSAPRRSPKILRPVSLPRTCFFPLSLWSISHVSEALLHKARGAPRKLSPGMSLVGGLTLGQRGRPQIRSFESQDLSICLRNVCGNFAETVVFPCKMTNKYCGDLRRRRIRAKTAPTNVKIQARETPLPQTPARGAAVRRNEARQPADVEQPRHPARPLRRPGRREGGGASGKQRSDLWPR